MSRLEKIKDLLRAAQVDCGAIAEAFEAATPHERVAITEALDGKEQEKLWHAAQGGKVTIEDMVPRAFGPLRPVVFHGKNSLPAFTHFQKRFCRPAPGVERDELWGYNYQPVKWLAPLTGPGYFVAYDANGLGGVAVDYTRIPPAKPAEWPEIHDNAYRLSRFIYNGTIDYLRGVSPHLLIGRATRAGKEMPNWFLLCREDPA